MRILYLSQYFPPEIGATQTRAYEMARNLVRMGHQVTMLSEIPNHPTGIIPPKYQGKLYEREILAGIDVVRVYVTTSPTKNTFTRMAFYLSYMINAFIAGLILAKGPYDIIYASSPPLFVACAGWMLSLVRGTPFVLEIRDLWPAVAINLGEISNSLVIRWAERLESFLYERATVIVVVTKGFRDHIIKLGIDSQKVTLIPNGTSPDIFNPNRVISGLRKKHQITNKFVVTYAGLHGIAQGLHAVLETARQILNYPQILFLFIGEGPQKSDLVAIKERDRLTNVIFLSEMPRQDVVPYLNISDVLLVPLRRDQLFEAFIPSKLYDYMACARPVILTVPGEAQNILEMAEAGVYVPPEDPHSLKNAILDLSRKSPEVLDHYGEKGRNFVIENFDRERQALKLAEVLQALIAPSE